MNVRFTRSTWALTILSLLNERSMHPYEMRRLIRERGKEDLVDLPSGSLYRTIEQLERAGLVEATETSRQGRFPERTVYRLTERGSDELEEWLRELLSRPRKDFPQLVAALSFLPNLQPDDVRAQLEKRIVRLEAEIAAHDAAANQLQVVLPRLFIIENEYARALRQAELAWVRRVVEDLRAGRLTWDRDELSERYACVDRPFTPTVDAVDEKAPRQE